MRQNRADIITVPGLLGRGCSVLCDVVLSLCFFLLPGVELAAGDDAPDVIDPVPVGDGAASAGGGGGACRENMSSL